MRIPVEQIQAAPKAIAYVEEGAALDQRLAGGAHDVRVPEGLAVDVAYYRAGLDVVFEGRLRGTIEATCARCAEPFPHPLETRFRVVLTPRAAASEDDGELSCEDLGFGFYEGDEIDLTALVQEHAILALPTRPLCRDDCRGLCARCGTNLNLATCGCDTQAERPRLAVLHDLVQARRGRR